MKVKEILDAIKEFDEIIGGVQIALLELDENILNIEVESVEHDHKKVNDKSIFVAIDGNTINSHMFIEDARRNGAALVIGQKNALTKMLPDVEVDSSRAVIGPIAAALNGFPSQKMNLIGVTGTNGKTTVSYLYSSMVIANNRNCFTMGTTGILMNGEKEADSQTTPDPLIVQNCFANFLTDGINDGALEVSSHALDQHRVLGTTFSAVGFTNFTQDHLDYHKTMEAYFESKMLLFSGYYSNTAVVNIDGPYSQKVLSICDENGLEVVKVSTKDSSADVFIEKKSMDITGSFLKAYFDGDDGIEFQTNMIGDFNHENISVALGLAKASGYELKNSLDALKNPLCVPGRMQRPNANTDLSIFVDYAHTPDALERVITTVKPLAKKIIVVFGCGGDRDKEKRPLMGKIVSELADHSIVTNDNPRSEDPKEIANQILSGAKVDLQIELDRRSAIEKAISMANAGDVVIVAGKGHERGQEFADRTEEFSDIEVVEEVVNAMEKN